MFVRKAAFVLLLASAFAAQAQTVQDPTRITIPQVQEPMVVQGTRQISYGVVQQSETSRVKAKASGVGAVAGGVVGAVLLSKLGSASSSGSKNTSRVLGAAGGALLGHYLERSLGGKTQYVMTVRMDDGSSQVITQEEKLEAGARVALENGRLSAVSQPPSLGNTRPAVPNTTAPIMQAPQTGDLPQWTPPAQPRGIQA